MGNKEENIEVNVVIDISPRSVQAIVANAKKINKPNERGFYRIDTADLVGRMISRFLDEKDFESYAGDLENYKEE